MDELQKDPEKNRKEIDEIFMKQHREEDKFKDGPYIFMPKKDDQQSHKYSHFVNIEQIQSKNVAEFLLTFDDSQ